MIFLKMTCKLSTTSLLSPILYVHLFLASHPISSPLADEVGTQDIAEEDGADGIDFYTVEYHLEAADVHLPPLLLIEPCDDQNRAETDYNLHQGYRYIGQVLLPDFQRGERVDVVITREASALWEQWLPLSAPHQQALALARRAQEELFRLDPSTLPREEASILWQDNL